MPLQVLLLEGVQSYSDPHFWSHSTDKWVGTLHVQVKDTADEQQIVGQVSSRCRADGWLGVARRCMAGSDRTCW